MDSLISKYVLSDICNNLYNLVGRFQFLKPFSSILKFFPKKICHFIVCPITFYSFPLFINQKKKSSILEKVYLLLLSHKNVNLITTSVYHRLNLNHAVELAV